MSHKEIKFTIIRKWPDRHTIDVHYYTDELMEAIQPTWERERKYLEQNFAPMPEEAMREKLVRDFPAGEVLHFQTPENVDTVEEMIEFILEKAPYDRLCARSKYCKVEPEMRLETEMKGHVFSGVPKYIRDQDALSQLPGVDIVP